MAIQVEIIFDEEQHMKHPPYHLRTNKAVDRLFLVNILRAFGAGKDFSNFTYYSLAGPFLEDLRVMDHFIPEMKLVSLESNSQTWERQKFNQFCSRLELKNCTLSDFFTHDYSASPYDVFWLDFTDLKFERFNEFQRVLRSVLPNSVVRITLRAEPEVNIDSLEDRLPEKEYFGLRKELEQSFENEFDLVLSPQIDLSNAFEKTTVFASLVQEMIKTAASQALDNPGSEVDFLPVQCTRYNDNTQMVSVTGIVCTRADIQAIRIKLEAIPFTNFGWEECHKINVPALTVKERLHLEKHLPIPTGQNAGDILFEALGYMIDNGAKRSKLQLTHYAECHREYPKFVQISI